MSIRAAEGIESEEGHISSSKSTRAPWLYSPTIDSVFILAPGIIVSLLLVFCCDPAGKAARASMSLGMWLVLVVCIDVAHVWSTTFRTYLDPEERERYRIHLTLIPLGCWLVGVVLYSAGHLVFWSLLAYTAVFHFVRQQYGFYALYARTETWRGRLNRELDTAAVYLATIFPLLYWHAHLPREFVWFIEGDFPFTVPSRISTLTGWLLTLVLAAQIFKELYFVIATRSINWPKNLIIWGTALSWYVGIVHFNADVPFTVANVVAHGIPYAALIWIFVIKKVHAGRGRSLSEESESSRALRWITIPYLGVVIFVGALILVAYVEEALWDALVWRERPGLFAWAWRLPYLYDSSSLPGNPASADHYYPVDNHVGWLALIVPLLAVPQATHYVLDAFIWRIRKPTSEVNHLL